MQVYREREVKLEVPNDWQLPDPVGALPPDVGVEREDVQLASTYFDTAHLDLLRCGLTLRRRTGDTDQGWQLKIPAGDARDELRLPPDGSSVPTELLKVTLGARAGQELAPIAVVKTHRAITRVVAGDGAALAEMVVDTVTGSHDSTIQTWREVEVELVNGDQRLLTDLTSWLGERGATAATVGSKIARTVGYRWPVPAAIDSLGDLLSTYLAAQHQAILRGDIDMRRGNEAIHDTRVATRRYRSTLRVFADVLDSPRADQLDAELKWYAAALGEVRDRQVMRRHLDGALAALPPELVMGPVADRIHQTLDSEQREAVRKLDEVMRGERYFALLRELSSWREELPVVGHRPAAKVRGYLAKSERKVARRLDAVPAGDGRAAALHRARKAAKRARYTAELGRPVIGKPAKKVRKRMKAMQDRLGGGQDAVITAEFLRRLGAAAGSRQGENGFTFGILYQRELDRFQRADPTDS